MKDKLNRFMQGRYGVDNFARLTLGVALFVIVVGSFMRQNAAGGVLDTVGFILIIYTYFRILSRNIYARYAENQKYLKMTAGIRRKLASWKSQLAQRKIYHIYRCPGCKQKIRVPRGRGKIEIRCPKCNTRFVKKS